MTTTDFLGFGDWSQQQRQEHRWSPARVADRAGIPRSTLGAFLSSQRRLQRPRRDVAIQIAAALKLPSLVLAVVACYADREDLGQADTAITGAVMPAWSREVAQRRSLLWSVAGGRYLSVIAKDAQLSSAIIRERWSAQTGDQSLDDAALGHLFEVGGVPSHWSELKMLDTLSGPALGLLTECVGGDAGDIIGIAAAMGRIGPGLAADWGAESDYTAWVSVVDSQGWGSDFEQFDAPAYRSAIREIAWTIPPLPEFSHSKKKFTLPAGQPVPDTLLTADTEDWAYLLARYPRLTPSQRSIIRQLMDSWLPSGREKP